MIRAYFFVPLLSFLATWVLSYVMRWVGHYFELFDGVSWRKVHTGSIPRLGGPAIAAGVMAPMVVIGVMGWSRDLQFESASFVPIFLGSMASLALGFSDDVKMLPSHTKLVGQMVIGTVVALMGLQIRILELPWFGSVSLGWLSVPCTVLWITLCMNATNLIDGLDGLSSSVVLVSCLALFWISTVAGFHLGIWVSLALIGALVGFLMHNFQPATIFMGDGGSYFLGFMVAALSIWVAQDGAQHFQPSVGFFVVGIALIDTGFAVARRLLQRRPLFSADGGHVHHCLIKRGLSVRQAVSCLVLIQVVFGSVSVVLYAGQSWQMGVALAFAFGLIGALFVEVVWRARTSNAST